jgi:hypothetical protein
LEGYDRRTQQFRFEAVCSADPPLNSQHNPTGKDTPYAIASDHPDPPGHRQHPAR